MGVVTVVVSDVRSSLQPASLMLQLDILIDGVGEDIGPHNRGDPGRPERGCEVQRRVEAGVSKRVRVVPSNPDLARQPTTGVCCTDR